MIGTFHTRARRILATALAAAICFAPAAARAATAQGSDANTAVAVNDKDGSSVFDVAFQIRRVSSGVVDQTNSAVSYASCESCQTVAIAIQIVLVSGGADTVTPTNTAIAINDQCTTCETVALAYQFVFGTSDVLGFTPEGQKRLNEIRKELRGLEKEGLTEEEISARVLDLTDQIRDVLATEVVIRGPGSRRGPNDRPVPGQAPDSDRTTPDERELPAPDEGEPAPDDDEIAPEDLPQDPGQPPPPTPEGGETQTTPPSGGPVAPDDSQGTTAP